MSDRPMAVPEGMEHLAHGELLINLPAEWQLSEEAFEDENNYWPIRTLKMLARLPHKYDTWLGHGHTVPNGDPPEPYASRAPFTGVLVEVPLSFGPDFFELKVRPDKIVYLYSLVPLYDEEMTLKLNKGVEHLENLFDRHGIGDVVDCSRKNVGKKKPFPKIKRRFRR